MPQNIAWVLLAAVLVFAGSIFYIKLSLPHWIEAARRRKLSRLIGEQDLSKINELLREFMPISVRQPYMGANVSWWNYEDPICFYMSRIGLEGPYVRIFPPLSPKEDFTVLIGWQEKGGRRSIKAGEALTTWILSFHEIRRQDFFNTKG